MSSNTISIVFRIEGLLPEDDVIKQYLKLAIDYDNNGGNTKYCITQMMHNKMTTDKGRRIASCRSLNELWLGWMNGWSYGLWILLLY